MILSKLRFEPVEMSEYSMSRQRRQYQEGLPVPLLQQTSRYEDLSNKKLAATQSQSTLFSRLHTELRLMIWRYTIGGQTLHIISKYKRLGHAVCDEEYWQQARSDKPSLRASSYMFVYGSLPTTKQLADWNMCNFLVVCQKVYDEVIPMLYQDNTFAFWDTRTITTFKAGILPQRWESIRSVEVYAMNYREDDNGAAVEVRSHLEWEHWPHSCSALRSLSGLRSLRIYVGNAGYFNKDYPGLNRSSMHEAALFALEHLEGIRVECEVHFPGTRGKRDHSQWRLCGFKHDERWRLQQQLEEDGLKCMPYPRNWYKLEEDAV